MMFSSINIFSGFFLIFDEDFSFQTKFELRTKLNLDICFPLCNLSLSLAFSQAKPINRKLKFCRHLFMVFLSEFSRKLLSFQYN